MPEASPKRACETVAANRTGDEEQFRLLALHLREVLWVADSAQTRMRYVSPAYETVWGRPREALFDHPQSFADAVEPQDRERVVRGVASVVNNMTTEPVVSSDAGRRPSRVQGLRIAGN